MLYDDDDHDLFLTPQVSMYSATRGGASRHMLVNGRDHKVAVKIKCSNNELYRVSPVFCNLEPGQGVRLQVVRDAGKPGTDKLIVEYRPSNWNNPRDAFKHLEDQDVSDICKKLIGLVAKEDRRRTVEGEEGEPPPIPDGPPPLMDGTPAPESVFAASGMLVRSVSVKAAPPVPTSIVPPLGMAFPLVPSKSIKRKPTVRRRLHGPPTDPPPPRPPLFPPPPPARSLSKRRPKPKSEEPPVIRKNTHCA